MVAVLQPAHPTALTETAPAPLPVVIVGAGPAGVRMVQELERRLPGIPMVLYGDEPTEPYNRVRLSSLLSGEATWADVSRDAGLPRQANLVTRYGCRVESIDRELRQVRDAEGRAQPYSTLILATGSRPHVPDIPGISLSGVYTFRDLEDAQRLAARRARSRITVVLGGGLLGLEAARGMQRFHTQVWVVEHQDRLMPRQLDDQAAHMLREHVEKSGIQVVLGDGPVALLGDTHVAGVRLWSGREIPCDTVIVSAGIRPNIEMARRAGLSVGRGIRVDDQMRATDPRIHAIGECAEHRGQVYGLVAPGLEQAAVAAHVISGAPASYVGSTAAMRLKVLRYPVFSMGEVGADQMPDMAGEHVLHVPGQDIYRKLVIRRGRLIGALAMGDWPQLARLRERVTRQARVWPWQLWRFRRTGDLWDQEAAASVADWPAGATVCNCTGITRGQLSEALAGGCKDAAGLAARTGASTVCGSCRPLLQELAGAGGPREPVRAHVPLHGLALAALVTGLAALLLPGLPYPDTVDLAWRWDMLWRDSLMKQVSGFTLLGLGAALAILGLRKRWKALRLWHFDHWRLAHTGIGVLAVLALGVHSGGRLGDQLNLLLAMSMLGLILSGAVGGVAIAREHRLDPALARRLRGTALWGHVIFLWPLPVLLGFHVFKTYYF